MCVYGGACMGACGYYERLCDVILLVAVMIAREQKTNFFGGESCLRLPRAFRPPSSCERGSRSEVWREMRIFHFSAPKKAD
jgi:hypothetical protein